MKSDDISLSIKNATTALQFLGTFNPTLDYCKGDVCILDGETVVYDGVGFQSMGYVDPCTETTHPPKKIVYGTCKYCGAPLKEETCEYCGVRNHAEN